MLLAGPRREGGRPMYETIDLKHEGEVAWLTFNRPHSLNALNTTLVDEFRDFLQRLPSERGTRVVVLRGSGRAFCAGLDLKEQNRDASRDEAFGSSVQTG